jgi:hypothetical protein
MACNYLNEYHEGIIDFTKLFESLREFIRYPNSTFNWQNYLSGTSTFSTWSGSPTTNIPTSPFTSISNSNHFRYYDSLGKEQTGNFYNSFLNKTICEVSSALGFGGSIDGTINNKINFTIELLYKDAIVTDAGNTITIGDYTSQKKYKAINIICSSYDEFSAACFAIKNASTFTKQTRYSSEFINALEPINTALASIIRDLYSKHKEDPSKLNAIFQDCPPALLSNITDDEKLYALKLLLKHDKGIYTIDGWFKDASSAFINIMRSFGEPTKLYDYFYDKPNELMDIYSYVNDEAVKLVLGQLIHAAILLKKQTSRIPLSLYDIGEFNLSEGFRLSGNYTDQSNPKIYLKNYRLAEYISGNQGRSELPIMDTKETEIIEKNGLHPFTLVPVRVGEELNYVPAIYLKALADQNDWNEISKNIRIGVDVFIILVSIASLGTASPLLTVVLYADLTLATVDLFLISQETELNKTPEGRQFLENYNKIVGGYYLISGGIGLAYATLRLGSKLILTVASFEAKNFLKAAMVKIALEINIANFTGNTLKNFPLVEKLSNFPKGTIDVLRDAGVTFTVGTSKEGAEIIYGVSYEGALIAIGDAQKIAKDLRPAIHKTGAGLIKALKELTLLVKKNGIAEYGNTIASQFAITAYPFQQPHLYPFIYPA